MPTNNDNNNYGMPNNMDPMNQGMNNNQGGNNFQGNDPYQNQPNMNPYMDNNSMPFNPNLQQGSDMQNMSQPMNSQYNNQMPPMQQQNQAFDPYNMQRDPNVLNFMMQMVQEKHGTNVDAQFLKTESERLYDDFGENLVNYFEPMLSRDQLKQFDQMLAGGANQEQLLGFLMSCIPDLTGQIEKVLLDYKDKYVMGV